MRAFSYLLALLLILCGETRLAAFDGERALDLIRQQCRLGPRIPGTSAHAKGRDWLAGQLRELGLEPSIQEFPETLPLTGRSVTCWNVWGLPAADGPTSPALLLSAHWDTRPYADHDPSGRRPLLDGANDGGSGVAVALEIARQLRNHPLRPRIALAFWDTEDSGVQGDNDSWALGSQYAAAHPPAWIDRVVLGINLDMVAGMDLRLRPERHSIRAAPLAVKGLWDWGCLLNPARFDNSQDIEVMDDHVPWIRRGLPYVNLIGYPYSNWHTAADTVDQCSPEVMQAVGTAVLEYLKGEPWASHGRPAGPLED